MHQARLARTLILAAVFLLTVGEARSPLGLMLQDHFGVAVLEEATNPAGTLFVLLDDILGKAYPDVEAAAEAFLRELVLQMAVIVYPATSHRGADTHEATVVRKLGAGAPVASTQGWSGLVAASEGPRGLGFLSIGELVYRHGSTTFLSTRPPNLAPAREPLAPAPEIAVAELSPLGLFLQERFGVAVLEEATNPQGTLFVLLEAIPGEPSPGVIEGAISGFARNQSQRISVVVYPKAVEEDLVVSHVATTVVRTAGGLTVAATKDWLDFIWDGEAAGPAGGLKVAGLIHSHGSTTFLADPTPPPPSSRWAPILPPPRSNTSTPSYSTPRPSYSPPSYSAPQVTCTSSTTSYGSNLSCYTDGRLTHQTICTVDSSFNVRCSTNSY
jgi:fumarate reductase subunit D